MNVYIRALLHPTRLFRSYSVKMADLAAGKKAAAIMAVNDYVQVDMHCTNILQFP